MFLWFIRYCHYSFLSLNYAWLWTKKSPSRIDLAFHLIWTDLIRQARNFQARIIFNHYHPELSLFYNPNLMLHCSWFLRVVFQKLYRVEIFTFGWQISYFASYLGGSFHPKSLPKIKKTAMIGGQSLPQNGCSRGESNPELVLRRRLLYPFNYENKCRFYKAFRPFGFGCHIYESNHFCDELSLFLILTFFDF